jgi:hypothetical protein
LEVREQKSRRREKIRKTKTKVVSAKPKVLAQHILPEMQRPPR